MGTESGVMEQGTSATPGAAPQAPQTQAAPSWYSQIPQDLQNVPMFQQLQNKDLPTVLRHAHELSQEVGRRIPADKAFQIPSDPNAPEWDTILSKLRPEDPTKYGFQVSPDLKWDEKVTSGIRQGFWNANLSEMQASKLMDMLSEGAKADQEADAQAFANQRAADEKALRDTFGQDYDIKMEQIQRVVKEFGAAEHFAKLGIDRDPKLMVMLSALGQAHAEGRVHMGTTGVLGAMNGGGNVAEIQSKIDGLRASDRWRQGDPTAVRELAELTAQRVEAEKQAAGGRPTRF